MKSDFYKKLKYEFKGIRDVIEDYTSRGNIQNFLDGLEKGMSEGSKEDILYFLNEICLWYQGQIGAIGSNQYVHNFDEHKRNKEIIEELNEQLKDYDFSSLEESSSKPCNKIEARIFISHRSSDKRYGDALRNLICGLGVKNHQLVYTSHPLHKIPLDADIYDFLRNNINNKVFVIILWSNEYLESPACLNEMGAAWVVQTDYTNIYTPEFSFGNPKYHQCAIDTRRMGAVLNGDAHCKASMIESRDKIKDLFDLDVDEQTWTYLLDQFITQIE